MIRDYGHVRVRVAQPEDAEQLAPRLRAADLAEIDAATSKTPLEILQTGLQSGDRSYTVELASGEVVALFGVAPTQEPRLGSVWLLASDGILQIRLTFLRHSLAHLRSLFAGYDLLGNMVDERNTVHVQWLRWLGFRFLRRVPCGRRGETFLEFVRLKDADAPVSHV